MTTRSKEPRWGPPELRSGWGCTVPASSADLSWDGAPPLRSALPGSGMQTTPQLLSQNGQRSLGCPRNRNSICEPNRRSPRPARKGPGTRAAEQTELTSCTREHGISSLTRFNDGFTNQKADWPRRRKCPAQHGAGPGWWAAPGCENRPEEPS